MLKKHHPQSKGVSLLEIMLATGVLSVLMLGVYIALNDWVLRGVNRQAAEDVYRVQMAAEGYVGANFNTTCYPSGIFNGTMRALPFTTLQLGGFVPIGTSSLNAHRQQIKIHFQCIAGNNTVTPAIPARAQILTLTDNPPGGARLILDEYLRDAALSIGPKMGMYSVLNTGSSIRSVTGSWEIANTSVLASGHSGTPTDDGGYLAAFGQVTNGGDVNASYLYKTPIQGRPDLAAMQTDLDMNGFAVTDVSTIAASTVASSGNVTITPTTPDTTALTVDDYLAVSGTNTTMNDLTISGGKASINTLKTNSNATFSSTGAVDAGSLDQSAYGQTASATYGVIDADSMAVNKQFVGEEIDMTGHAGASVSAQNMQAGTLRTDGDINAQGILIGQATNLTAGSKDMTVMQNASNSAGLNLQSLNVNTRTGARARTHVKQITCTTVGTAPQCAPYTP